MTTPSLPLLGKVALVTGGAKRVGKAIALTLAQQGADIALTYLHSAAEAQQTATEIQALGRRVLTLAVDFANAQAAPGQVIDAVTEQFGRLDILINNASCFAPQPLGEITLEEVQRNLAVNALSPLMLIQRAAPWLRRHFDPADPRTLGRVVNFIDIHVMGQPLPGYLPYNLSKAALQEITRTAALELAPAITVNALAPGVVAWADSYTEQMKADYLRRVPLGRAGTPEDAAAAALYLVRDAHYCTGQTIRLDGGRLWT